METPEDSELSRGKWSKGATLQLIALVEERRNLWLASHPDHKNRQKRKETLLEIAAYLGINAQEVSRKVHNLRCQLNEEQRKVYVKRANGDESYCSQWEYYQPLQFIINERPYKYENISLEKLTPKRRKLMVNTTLGTDISAFESPNEDNVPSPHSSYSFVKRSQSDDEKVDRHFEIIHNKYDDEHRVFGEYVASEMRKMKNPKIVEQLGVNIQQMIVNAWREVLEARECEFNELC